MRLAWLAVMKECSTSRSARLRWLGSEACFCCSRQKSISVSVARPVSTTTWPTSVSRLGARPLACCCRTCDHSLVSGHAAVRRLDGSTVPAKPVDATAGRLTARRGNCAVHRDTFARHTIVRSQASGRREPRRQLRLRPLSKRVRLNPCAASQQRRAACGGRSSVGRAPGCGPGRRGFESRRSPGSTAAAGGSIKLPLLRL